jgi:hypothetical protein
MASGVLAHKSKKERLKPMLDTFYATIGRSRLKAPSFTMRYVSVEEIVAEDALADRNGP